MNERGTKDFMFHTFHTSTVLVHKTYRISIFNVVKFKHIITFQHNPFAKCQYHSISPYKTAIR